MNLVHGDFKPSIVQDGTTDPKRVFFALGQCTELPKVCFTHDIEHAGRSSHFQAHHAGRVSPVKACPSGGLCLAMGILGFKPMASCFRHVPSPQDINYTWGPMSKVRHSYNLHMRVAVREDYVQAAVELSILLMDSAPGATAAWLMAGLEHQIPRRQHRHSKYRGSASTRTRCTQSSYVPMILSLNNATYRTRHYGAVVLPPFDPTSLVRAYCSWRRIRRSRSGRIIQRCQSAV